jgi:hypothetical protein
MIVHCSLSTSIQPLTTLCTSSSMSDDRKLPPLSPCYSTTILNPQPFSNTSSLPSPLLPPTMSSPSKTIDTPYVTTVPPSDPPQPPPLPPMRHRPSHFLAQLQSAPKDYLSTIPKFTSGPSLRTRLLLLLRHLDTAGNPKKNS